MRQIKNISPVLWGLLQATVLLGYTALMGSVLMNGTRWFGNLGNAGFVGPMLFLTLLCFSAMFCSITVGGYPAYLIWKEKEIDKAFKVGAFTVGWFLLYLLAIILFLLSFH